jgi:hypothetical protein
MSHATGKIEIVGKTAGHIFMRYHQSADPANIGKFMVFQSNPVARWFDDYRHQATHIGDLLPMKKPKMQWLFRGGQL